MYNCVHVYMYMYNSKKNNVVHCLPSLITLAIWFDHVHVHASSIHMHRSYLVPHTCTIEYRVNTLPKHYQNSLADYIPLYGACFLPLSSFPNEYQEPYVHIHVYTCSCLPVDVVMYFAALPSLLIHMYMYMHTFTHTYRMMMILLPDCTLPISTLSCNMTSSENSLCHYIYVVNLHAVLSFNFFFCEWL